MVNLLDSGTSVPGLSPGREHCVVFLGKLLYPYSACLSPRCINTGEFNARGSPEMD